MVSGIIFYGVAIVLPGISFFKDRAKTRQALLKPWKAFEGMLPRLTPNSLKHRRRVNFCSPPMVFQ